MILEYDAVNGENTLLSKPVYSAVSLYLLNFIIFTSDKPIDLYYKKLSVILSSVRFNCFYDLQDYCNLKAIFNSFSIVSN